MNSTSGYAAVLLDLHCVQSRKRADDKRPTDRNGGGIFRFIQIDRRLQVVRKGSRKKFAKATVTFGFATVISGGCRLVDCYKSIEFD